VLPLPRGSASFMLTPAGLRLAPVLATLDDARRRAADGSLACTHPDPRNGPVPGARSRSVPASPAAAAAAAAAAAFGTLVQAASSQARGGLPLGSPTTAWLADAAAAAAAGGAAGNGAAQARCDVSGHAAGGSSAGGEGGVRDPAGNRAEASSVAVPAPGTALPLAPLAGSSTAEGGARERASGGMGVGGQSPPPRSSPAESAAACGQGRGQPAAQCAHAQAALDRGSRAGPGAAAPTAPRPQGLEPAAGSACAAAPREREPAGLVERAGAAAPAALPGRPGGEGPGRPQAGMGCKERAGLRMGPVFVPIVLCMDEADHALLVREWYARGEQARPFAESHLPTKEICSSVWMAHQVQGNGARDRMELLAWGRAWVRRTLAAGA